MGEAIKGAARWPNARLLVISAVVAGLATTVGIALKRELASKPQATTTSAAAQWSAGIARHEARALSPEEEVYAGALWPIHSEVKLAAVRMTFAGLNYKLEHGDAGQLKSRVQPLVQIFKAAALRAGSIKAPPSLADAHRSYVEALDAYAEASQEMLRVAADGKDEHLVAAQQRSERASEALLKVSDVLWPGEYKPN